MNDEAPESLTEDSFDLMEYLTTGTVARRQVTIYNDPEAGDLLAETLEKLAELGWSDDPSSVDEPADGPLSSQPEEDPEVLVLLDVAQGASERLEASKTVWTVRAISEDEAEAAFEAVPAPKVPMPPKDNAPQGLQDKFARQVMRYSQEKAEADHSRKLHLIATAVVSVEHARGAAEGATVEMLRALRTRPHGEQWIGKLYAAVEDAQGSDPDIPRPTWLGRSTSTQG